MADIPFWRDVSLIVLALEAIVLCLPALIVGILVVRGLNSAQRGIRRFAPIAQSKAVLGRDYTEKYAALATAPLLAVAGAAAAMAAAVSVLRSRGGEARGGTRG